MNDEEKKPTATAAPNSTLEELSRLGHRTDDGLECALIEFQWARGLPATGVLDADTREALAIAIDTAQ